jgi:hypothetical protein
VNNRPNEGLIHEKKKISLASEDQNCSHWNKHNRKEVPGRPGLISNSHIVQLKVWDQDARRGEIHKRMSAEGEEGGKGDRTEAIAQLNVIARGLLQLDQSPTPSFRVVDLIGNTGQANGVSD